MVNYVKIIIIVDFNVTIVVIVCSNLNNKLITNKVVNFAAIIYVKQIDIDVGVLEDMRSELEIDVVEQNSMGNVINSINVKRINIIDRAKLRVVIKR